MNPDILITHAVDLLREDASDVVLRRAVSAAYYGIFHSLCRMVADEYVGNENRSTFEYARCYRAIDHSRVKNLHQSYKLSGGADPAIELLCVMARDMQIERHRADYDPNYEIEYEQASTLVLDTMLMFHGFGNSLSSEQIRRLSALLMFQERRQ